MSTKLYDVAILTESRYESPTDQSEYVQNILEEDGLVKSALEKHGLKVIRLDWARPDFDWSTVRVALFRTVWDYFNKFDAFQKWLEHAAQQTQLINPPELIHWNMDKHYLRDLMQRGVHCTPTIFIPIGSTESLTSLHQQHDLKETVLKPAVSGAARHTYRLNPDNYAEHETIFQELIANEAMLLQPFQYNVLKEGEITLVLINGKYTHAIKKIAKAGDFRVQDDFGGTVHHYTATEDEIHFAEHALAQCDPAPIYARVDIIRDNSNQLAVSELEMIEPELWFRYCPEAAQALADGIAKKYFGVEI